MVWVTVPFYPFLLALSETDETTEATQQTNTPVHRPEDNYLSQQPRALPWIFQMTVIGVANFTNSLYFDGLEQNNYARLPNEKPEMKTLGLVITWFNLNARELKGSKSEYVCMFTPHGTLTSWWATEAFYNFHKWY